MPEAERVGQPGRKQSYEVQRDLYEKLLNTFHTRAA